ncbi:MAG: thioredoxin family protein [Saprospiraceae bacterium]|nr:thioredoxin family protein [Saprospiraceae bacterium]
MRLLLLLFSALFLTVGLSAQMVDPVKWDTHIDKISKEEYQLVFTADMDPGWMLYSQHTEDGGPIPTTFYFNKGAHYSLVGEVDEKGKKKEGRDPLFDNIVVIKYPKGPVVFTQIVKVADPSQAITVEVEYMSCNDQTCTPPMLKDFSFDVSAVSGGDLTASADEAAELQVTAKEAQQEASVSEIAPTNVITDAAKESETSGLLEETATSLLDNAGGAEQSGVLEPVKWSFTSKKTGEGEYTFIATAKVEAGWSMPSYKSHIDGPPPLEIYWEHDSTAVVATGEIQELTKIKTAMDEMFGVEVSKYVGNPVVIQQTFKSKEPNPVVKGFMVFTVCDDEKCLPPTEAPFSIDLSTGQAASNIAVVQPQGESLDQRRASLAATYKEPLGNCGEEVVSSDSLFWTFILGFLGGLVALLTPCVFPMIPLTVSFFTKTSKDRASSLRNALIYGISIILIYVSIGLIITGALGPGALNALSTNWIANMLFFAIFVAFAFSFFGYYEITLPSSWSTKSDAMADKGGLIGIFFMAFTLALVSFSCTGPIIGSALVESATNKMGPMVVMLGFSSALALPFGLFAAFPGWLNSLPRSGSWMTSVKVVLGFLELALALKFLSVADMTMHWGILPYEVFMGLWVLIFAGMALYLLGYIRFPHDSKLKKISPTRWGFIIASLAAVVYLATGFGYNQKTQAYQSLKIMSGLAPPAHYNILLPEPDLDPALKARFPSYSKCANNLECFKDYYEGVTYAKEINKPVLLDFTGHGCVNCRKTEEHIWTAESIWERITEDYVLISLYVDDRNPLDKPLVSKLSNKKLRNVGHMWTDFQVTNFQQNTQPLYVLMSPGEKVLAAPRGYKEGVRDYSDFLDCGLNTFMRTNQGALGSR